MLAQMLPAAGSGWTLEALTTECKSCITLNLWLAATRLHSHMCRHFLPCRLTRQGHVCRIPGAAVHASTSLAAHSVPHLVQQCRQVVCPPAPGSQHCLQWAGSGQTPLKGSHRKGKTETWPQPTHAHAEPGIRPLQARWRRPRSPSAGRPPTSSTAPGTARARPRRATSSALCCPPSWSLCGAPWSCPWSCTGGEPASDGGHPGCCGTPLSGHARCPVQLRHVHVVVLDKMWVGCYLSSAMERRSTFCNQAIMQRSLQAASRDVLPLTRLAASVHPARISMLHVGLPVPSGPHIMRSSRGCRWSGVRCARVSGPA